MTPINPDHTIAGIRLPDQYVPHYGLDMLVSDPHAVIEPTAIEVPADRLGLHLHGDGSTWLVVDHPHAAGRPVTLLSLADDRGRAAALAVLPEACADCARGMIGAARITAAPELGRLVVLDAVYVDALGIERRAS